MWQGFAWLWGGFKAWVLLECVPVVDVSWCEDPRVKLVDESRVLLRQDCVCV